MRESGVRSQESESVHPAVRCTWAGCERSGSRVCRSVDRTEPWARLCPEHDLELNDAIDSGDPRRIMPAYVKAKGGAKAAAADLMGTHG